MKSHSSEPYAMLFFPVLFGLLAALTDPVTSFYVYLYIGTNAGLLLYAIHTSRKIAKDDTSSNALATFLTVNYIMTSLLCLVPGLKANGYVWVWIFLWSVWFLTFFIYYIGPRWIPILKHRKNQMKITFLIFALTIVLIIPTGVGVGPYPPVNDELRIVDWLGESKGMRIITFMISLTFSLMFLTFAQITGKMRSGAWNTPSPQITKQRKSSKIVRSKRKSI